MAVSLKMPEGNFMLSETLRLLDGSGKTYPVNCSVDTTETSISTKRLKKRDI